MPLTVCQISTTVLCQQAKKKFTRGLVVDGLGWYDSHRIFQLVGHHILRKEWQDGTSNETKQAPRAVEHAASGVLPHGWRGHRRRGGGGAMAG